MSDEKTRAEYNTEVRVELGLQIRDTDTATEPTTEIYMDGSSTGRRPEDRKGGWAFVVVQDGRQSEIHFGKIERNEVEVISNNSAELMAARMLLLWLIQKDLPENTIVRIRPDSMLVIKWLTGMAKSGHHRELINECRLALAKLRQKIIIRWRHVRAHRGHYFNEMVDEHAKAGADGRSSAFRPQVVLQERELPPSLTHEEARHKAVCFAAALRAAGLKVLGEVPMRGKPQWMKDNETKIEELIEDKNKKFDKLCDNPSSEVCKTAYKTCCLKYKNDLKKMLNDWWSKRADEMELASSGKVNPEVWETIPELRSVLKKNVTV